MSNSNNNRKVVPEAREALNKFKYEVASEVGVNLKDGYNGDISVCHFPLSLSWWWWILRLFQGKDHLLPRRDHS